MTLYSQTVVCFVSLVIFTAHASANTRKTKAPARPAAQPFTSFRRIDSHLTTMDRDLKDLDARVNEMNSLHARVQRQRALTNFRRSATLRSLRSSSVSLLAITQALEVHYGKRRQQYGVRLFSSLHLEALHMIRSETRMDKANTVMGVKSARRRFATDMLSFILKFQAISGGYGALECGPGQWACCQPKSVGQLGVRSLQGCTWGCTASIHNCRSGCLGPRTPKNARVAANAARQNSQAR